MIAVGAVTNSGVRASYSCYGSALDLVAVGSDVISTAWSGTGYSYLLGYGTSFSAPFVAALAALTLSVNAGMTPDQIETAMEKNATDLGASGWDQYYGAGCIDFYGTLAGQRDTVPPVITLRGESTVYVTVGSAYADAGATAYDNKDGDLSAFIAATSTVNAAIKGTYAVTYTVADSSGNKATAARSVIVKENAKPVITLNGAASLQVAFGSTYIDPGAIAKDAEDGDISASITTDNPVNTLKAGTYKVNYTVTDSGGLKGTFTRTVIVKPNTKPIITLNGAASLQVVFGSTYIDPGATAKDAEDGDISASITKGNPVNTLKAGTYKVIYTVTDRHGAMATATRTVVVRPNAKPVITLNGAASLQVAFGSTYIDPGATAKDAEDGYISASITIDNPVNTFKAGTYKVTYTVTDRHGAMATATRTVVVRPNAKPVITILGKKTVIIKLGETYIDSGATARDVEDGDLTALIVTTGTVNTAVAGTYTVTYTVTDKAGATITAARRIIVQ